MQSLDQALHRLEAMPPPGTVLYHGTSGSAARQIAAQGYIEQTAPRPDQSKGWLRPLDGRSYLTADLWEALKYAHIPSSPIERPPEIEVRQRSRNEDPEVGLVVVQDAGGSAYPDEDHVGMLMAAGSTYSAWAANGVDNAANTHLQGLEWYWPGITEAAKTYYPRILARLTPKEQKQVTFKEDHDLQRRALQARIGKFVIQILSQRDPELLTELAALTPNVSFSGKVPVSEVWLMPRGTPVGDRGARFFDVAQQIPVVQPAITPTAALHLTAFRAIHFVENSQDPSSFADISTPRAGEQPVNTKWNEITFTDQRAALDQMLRSGNVGLTYVNGELWVSATGNSDLFGQYASQERVVYARAEGGKINVSQGAVGFFAYPGSPYQPQLRPFVSDLEQLVPGLLYTLNYNEEPVGAADFVASLGDPNDVWDPKRALVLYHGTSSRLYYEAEFAEIKDKIGARARPIEYAGLLPPGLTGNINWSGSTGSPYGELYDQQVYLATTQRQGLQYADHAVDNYGGRRLVLEVTVPDKSKLLVDDDFHGVPTASSPEAGLVYFGQVAYRGRIPPTYLRVAYEDPWRDGGPRQGLVEQIPAFQQLSHETGRIKRFLETYKDSLPVKEWEQRGTTQALDLRYASTGQWQRVDKALGEMGYAINYLGYFEGKTVNPEMLEAAAQRTDAALTAMDRAAAALEPYMRDAEKIVGQPRPPDPDQDSLLRTVRPSETGYDWMTNEVIDPLGGWARDREDAVWERVYALEGQLEMPWAEGSNTPRQAFDLVQEWRQAAHDLDEAFSYKEFGYLSREKRTVLVKQVAARHDWVSVVQSFRQAAEAAGISLETPAAQP